jgi:hypothetical protein
VPGRVRADGRPFSPTNEIQRLHEHGLPPACRMGWWFSIATSTRPGEKSAPATLEGGERGANGVKAWARVVLYFGIESIKSGPSNPASPSPGQPETLLVRVERLRQQADAFHRTVERALRTARGRVDELRVRQAKRRRAGRRRD